MPGISLVPKHFLCCSFMDNLLPCHQTGYFLVTRSNSTFSFLGYEESYCLCHASQSLASRYHRSTGSVYLLNNMCL